MTPVTDLALAGIIDDPTGVNSQTVLAIATELRAFRAADGATPPDVQHYTFPSPGYGGFEHQVEHYRREFEQKDMVWMRVTKHTDGKLYFDGWRVRPRKEAPFEVLPSGEQPQVLESRHVRTWMHWVDITGPNGEPF